MIPLCLSEGVGVIPWSPLARGRLARSEATVRSGSDRLSKQWYPESQAQTAIVETVRSIAKTRGIPPAQLGLAWVLSKPAVSAPVIGVSKPHHLLDALGAIDVELTAEEIAALEAPYVPTAVVAIEEPWRVV